MAVQRWFICATLVSLFFVALASADGFIFPSDDASDLEFFEGDKLNVSWTSSYDQPSLQLYCGASTFCKAIRFLSQIVCLTRALQPN